MVIVPKKNKIDDSLIIKNKKILPKKIKKDKIDDSLIIKNKKTSSEKNKNIINMKEKMRINEKINNKLLRFYKRKNTLFLKNKLKKNKLKKQMKPLNNIFRYRFFNKRLFLKYKLSKKHLLSSIYALKDKKKKKVIYLNKEEERKKKKNARRLAEYWLFIKPTVNNLFVYISNLDSRKKKMSILKRRFYQKKKIKIKKRRVENKNISKSKVTYMCLSLGISGHKGPTKTSYVAAQETGLLFRKKLFEKKIKLFNLVLLCRLNRRIRMFLKGLFTGNKFDKEYKNMQMDKLRQSKRFKRLKRFQRKKKIQALNLRLFKLHEFNKLNINYIYSLPRRAHNGSRLKKRRRK